MPAEQSNERVKRYTIYACVEDGCRYYRDTFSTGVHVAGIEGRVKHKVAPIEVIPADSSNVLSVEEARLLREFAAVDYQPDEPLSEREREARAIFDRLRAFAEEADRG